MGAEYVRAEEVKGRGGKGAEEVTERRGKEAE
jgi:hypothetical protein